MFGREPALIMGLVQMILAGAVAFGLDLTSDQTAAVLGISAALLSVVTRQKVNPVAKS